MNKYDQQMQKLTRKFDGLSLPERKPIILSEADLDGVERAIGHTLPSDYRTFLRDYGMSFLPTRFRLPFPKPHGPEFGSINTFVGVTGKPYDLLWEYRMLKEAGLPQLLRIGTGDQGSVELILTGDEKGSVYFWDGSEGSTGNFFEDAVFVASSFDDFINLLEG